VEERMSVKRRGLKIKMMMMMKEMFL